MLPTDQVIFGYIMVAASIVVASYMDKKSLLGAEAFILASITYAMSNSIFAHRPSITAFLLLFAVWVMLHYQGKQPTSPVLSHPWTGGPMEKGD